MLCMCWEVFLSVFCSYVQQVCSLKCLLTKKKKLQRFRFKGPHKTHKGVYLIAGQNMWCHYGITKPVTLLHYREQHNTPYVSTQAARVTATDRRNLLFKLLSYKHAASPRLCSLSSHPPSDCCGEVLLRDYPLLPPPTPHSSNTHTYTHSESL